MDLEISVRHLGGINKAENHVESAGTDTADSKEYRAIAMLPVTINAAAANGASFRLSG